MNKKDLFKELEYWTAKLEEARNYYEPLRVKMYTSFEPLTMEDRWDMQSYLTLVAVYSEFINETRKQLEEVNKPIWKKLLKK